MSGASWALWVVVAVMLLGAAVWLYRTREPGGRGRVALGALHALIVAVVALLLFDPSLPMPGRTASTPQVLLDASLSMSMSSADDEQTFWQRAVAEARMLAGDAPVILFGEVPRPVRVDSLADAAPIAASSRLVPALQAAAEAGARRVIVLTDGGITDAAEAGRWIPRLGLEVEYRALGPPLRNRAIVELQAPRWADAGEPVEFVFGVSATQPGTDSVRVSVSRADSILTRATVSAPVPGRVTTGVLRFTPEGSGEWVRYDVRIEGDDAAPDDDVRTAYVLVSDRPTGVAMLTLQPDWELRFLQPVLAQALGLPARAWLRAQGDDYVRMGAGLEAGVPAELDEVQRALREAELVVIHGLDAASPRWVVEAASRARRLLVLPSGDVSALGLPVHIRTPVPAEWYPVATAPPSPVAPLLTGLDVSLAPPLTALAAVEQDPATWTPLLATRGRQGAPAPLAVAGQSGGRRWVVGLGQGYWRWAFRGGTARQLYARLWSALGGWLIREQGAVSLAAVRPASPVIPRGAPVRWVAPGLAADSLHVSLTRTDGTAVIDTTVRVAADTAATATLPPAHYRYQARAFVADSVAGTGEGEITAETWSPEFQQPVVALASLESAVAGAGDPARWSGRPLHTTPWPYAALILLLSILWVLRRRWGLR